MEWLWISRPKLHSRIQDIFNWVNLRIVRSDTLISKSHASRYGHRVHSVFVTHCLWYNYLTMSWLKPASVSTKWILWKYIGWSFGSLKPTCFGEGSNLRAWLGFKVLLLRGLLCMAVAGRFQFLILETTSCILIK